MNQKELNEIWRRHKAEENYGADLRVTETRDLQIIEKQIDGNREAWERKKEDEDWEQVPPLGGNL